MAVVLIIAEQGRMTRGVTSVCNDATTAFCDAVMKPPPNWPGHVFHLSQRYPSIAPQDVRPWINFDPRTQPIQYLTSVLRYFYEGNLRPNVEESFDPAQNQVRGWYHAPWQDFGLNGREFIHGLTRERVSLAGELASTQVHKWNNYAVGFYNAAGATAIGRVWLNHIAPNPNVATMPDGTVAAKLLFTTAPVNEVPYLAGSPQWNGYVYADLNDPTPTPTSPRAVRPVRLLQIDIAVKDQRFASVTGWIFGTFVYGGGPGGRPGSGWTNVAPVGLMWGNDPQLQGEPRQTVLNSAVRMPHVGYQGRLNGPVDNPISSCLSCHSTSEFQKGIMVPPLGTSPAPWFRNISSGVPFDAGRISLDYSLQLEVGLSNFSDARAISRAPSPAARQMLIRRLFTLQAKPPRDGGREP